MQWLDLMTQLSTKYPDATARVICDVLNEPDFGNLRFEAQPDAGLPGLKDLYLDVMDLIYPVASSAFSAYPKVKIVITNSSFVKHRF